MGNTTALTAGRILQAAEKSLELWSSDRASLDDYLDFYLECPELRRPVSSILFSYFRNKALIDHAIARTAERGIKPRYRRLLAIVITQGWFQTGITLASAVNVAVSYAASRYGARPAGFINALLRTVFKNGRDMVEATLSPTEKLNLPPVIHARWQTRWSGPEIAAIAGLTRSPAAISFRARKPLALEELAAVAAVPVTGLPWLEHWHFYESGNPAALFKTDWLEQGRIYVQDPATALAPALPEIHGGERIADLCAAPGGKSLMLAERLGAGGELVAMDKSERRQRLTADNFRRHGVAHKIIVASATAPPLEPANFDIVLIDVPCSNTGVFRRRPDALWRFTESGLAAIVQTQAAIFDAAACLVRPGGQLIYSTCSLEPEENEAQVAAFLARRPEFALKTSRLLTPTASHDGGFAALLSRSAANDKFNR